MECCAGSRVATSKAGIGHPIMNASDDRTKINAVLRHLGCGQDLRDFAGTASEKLALVRTAASRGLIVWQRGRGRYELTSIGWSELTPRRRFTLASMAASTAVGAALGAAALAILWLPADASHRSVGRPTASASRAADANGGAPAPASAPQTASAPSAATAVPHDPAPSARPGNPTEPAKVVDQPAPEEPSAEAAPTVVKQAAVKKPRRKTASRRQKEETGATWAYADSWRARSQGYGYGGQSGYGGQGSGFFR